MSTVHVRIEVVETGYPPDPVVYGYRAYAADIGLAVEDADLAGCIAKVKAAIETYLDDEVSLIWMKGEMRFSTE